MLPDADFNWREPDYTSVIEARYQRLLWLRQEPERWDDLLAWYKAEDCPDDLGKRVAAFIHDWGWTFDPRNIEIGQPASVPFLLFPRQAEWVEFIVRKWRERKPGLTEKSRDGGLSWLSVSTAATMCLLLDELAIGFGSRKEEYVDKLGSPKSLFYKARMYLRQLPPELLGGWDESKHAPFMRIIFPGTGSVITGEAGDNIGRGDRSSLYFVDEAAYLERPALTEASLSQTTNCRQDISSANGMDNPFAQKRHAGKIEVFTFHWRHDPRKDDAWYAKQCDELDAVTVAQEIDINYAASATGILIPGDWVQAAVNAHERLDFDPTGRSFGAMDVADGGADANAYSVRNGVLLAHVEEWHGSKADGDDIFASVERSFFIADTWGLDEWWYDADGLGAGVRGDARVINATRREAGQREHTVSPFRGSGEVYRKEATIPTASTVPGGRDRVDRKNGDFFANYKAQGWWDLRVRFQRTFRAVRAGSLGAYRPDQLISISKDIPPAALAKLLTELSQPTYTPNTVGKIVIDKAPEGTKSPNHADSAMINFAPRRVSFLSYLD